MRSQTQDPRLVHDLGIALPAVNGRDADGHAGNLQIVALSYEPDDLTAFGATLSQLEPCLRGELVALVARHERGERIAGERSICRLHAQLR